MVITLAVRVKRTFTDTENELAGMVAVERGCDVHTVLKGLIKTEVARALTGAGLKEVTC